MWDMNTCDKQVCVYILNCYFITGSVPEVAKEKVAILGYNWTVEIST